MDPNTLLYVGIGLGIVVLLAAVVLLLLRRRGNLAWGPLAEKYATDKEPAGKLFNRHTVKVGKDVCRKCVTVVVADPGLYLRADGLLNRRPGVLIPWDQFRDVTEGKLDVHKAAVLTVGDPPAKLVMPMRLYDRVRSHMPGQLRRRV